MKHLKKLAGLALALVMVMALAMPAFASGDNPGKITLKNPSDTPATATHTYNVYRVFDMSRANDSDDPNVPLTYTASQALKDAIEKDSTVSAYFTFTATNDPNKFTVAAAGNMASEDQATAEAAAKAFSQWLKDNKALLTAVPGGTELTLTGPGGETAGQTTLNVPYGYYFVDSTVGSLLMLNSTNPTAEITDKNLDPTVGKESNAPANVKIGDKIDYTISINVVEGTDKEYVLHDKMGVGLELVADSIEVKVDGADVSTENYILTKENLSDGCAFEIEFKADYLKTIPNKSIVVTYGATILDTAAIPEGGQVIQLDNEAKVVYGDNDETAPSTTTDKLYKFDLVKTDDDDKLLDKAEFELYTAASVNAEGNALIEGATPIKFTYDSATKTYKVCTDNATGATTTIVVEGGKVSIDGLKGTYYLKETKAPSGYNELTALVKIDIVETKDGTGAVTAATVNGAELGATINGDTYTSGGVRVENKAGTLLPSTGGIGTTIFYIVGGGLVVGAVVLLITKRRAGSDEE